MLVAAGGHAWGMTGFAATADPRRTTDCQVTRVHAMGPLWPDATLGGRLYDPGPGSGWAMRALRKKFVVYRRKIAPEWDGRRFTVNP